MPQAEFSAIGLIDVFLLAHYPEMQNNLDRLPDEIRKNTTGGEDTRRYGLLLDHLAPLIHSEIFYGTDEILPAVPNTKVTAVSLRWPG